MAPSEKSLLHEINGGIKKCRRYTAHLFISKLKISIYASIMC